LKERIPEVKRVMAVPNFKTDWGVPKCF
jgi:hypothetical protein